MEKFELIPPKNILLEYHYTHFDHDNDATKYVKILKFITIHSSDYNNLPNNSNYKANNVLPIYLYVNPANHLVYTKDRSHIIYSPDESPFLFSITNYTDASTYISTVKVNSNLKLEKSPNSQIPYIFAFDEEDCLCFYVRNNISRFTFTLKVLNSVYNKINEYIEINDVHNDKNVVDGDALTLVDLNILPVFERNSNKDSFFNNRTSKMDNNPTITKCFYYGALFYCSDASYYAVPAYNITKEEKFYGTYDKRPTTTTAGFPYFCIDRKTLEGQRNGIMIYYDGNGVWVDALGRPIE